MKQVELLAEEFQKLFNGASWIDVNIVATLASLNAEQAAAKPFANVNSIWEIVNHLVNWREAVLKRVNGIEFPSPENNFFEPVADISPKAWNETLQRLHKSQNAWTAALYKMDDSDLEKQSATRKQMKYELISGILQHDAYHLGQVVILKKFV